VEEEVSEDRYIEFWKIPGWVFIPDAPDVKFTTYRRALDALLDLTRKAVEEEYEGLMHLTLPWYKSVNNIDDFERYHRLGAFTAEGRIVDVAVPPHITDGGDVQVTLLCQWRYIAKRQVMCVGEGPTGEPVETFATTDVPVTDWGPGEPVKLTRVMQPERSPVRVVGELVELSWWKR
jgi:hypothetical protein